MFRKKVTLCLGIGILLFATVSVCFADAAAKFKLAEKYSRDRHDFAQAENVLKTIIAEHPNSSDSLKAQRKIITLHIAEDKTSEAQAEFDKMLADYAGNPQLTEEIYWVGRGYRVAEDYEQAKSLYQMVLQRDPNSTWANRSRINIKNMEVWMLIKAGQFAQAKTALDQMTIDFSGDSYLPEALYWTGRKLRRANQFADASNLYTRIVQTYPNDAFAKKASLELPNCLMQQAFNAGDHNSVSVQIDSIINSFPKDANLASMLFKIAERYFHEGFELQKSDAQKGTDYIKRSAAISEKIALQLPPSADYTPEAMIRAANAYRFCGDYTKAIPCYEKVVSDWPEYSFAAEARASLGDSYLTINNYQKALQSFEKIVKDYPTYSSRWHILYMLADTYENMKQKGLVSAEEADSKIKAAYQEIVSRYPDCKAALAAGNWLKAH